MGKIMCKLKHNYNAFQELQTNFFSQTMRHLVISTEFQFFKISGTINDDENSYIKRYLQIGFSKYNETSQKLFYS